MCHAARNRGFSLMEILGSLVIILILLAILLPSLNNARVNSRRETCRSNQRDIFTAFRAYLDDHNHQFPGIAVNAAWAWGGVRFDRNDQPVALDDLRPINDYLPCQGNDKHCLNICACPADSGIGGASRSAFRAYGTSYRANARLFDAARTLEPNAPPDSPVRGMTRGEITRTTPPSRLLIFGDPIWFEVAESTGRDADWHASPNFGNLTFLDGSVRFLELFPRSVQRGILYEPLPPIPAAAPTPHSRPAD